MGESWQILEAKHLSHVFCRLGNAGTIFPTWKIPSHIIFQLETKLTTD